ncbi:hypothetical protein IEU95_13200, partial [Hoyosella rhizosphaerae]|uniref:hypothetical protein n=1 Tax=Hoyosella rhizosphaerae TaxID=1755582 RepID=UPI00197DC69C
LTRFPASTNHQKNNDTLLSSQTPHPQEELLAQFRRGERLARLALVNPRRQTRKTGVYLGL